MTNSVVAPHGAEAAPQAGDVSASVVPESDGVRCRRCGDVYADRDEAEGCRDFHCPMQEPSND